MSTTPLAFVTFNLVHSDVDLPERTVRISAGHVTSFGPRRSGTGTLVTTVDGKQHEITETPDEVDSAFSTAITEALRTIFHVSTSIAQEAVREHALD